MALLSYALIICDIIDIYVTAKFFDTFWRINWAGKLTAVGRIVNFVHFKNILILFHFMWATCALGFLIAFVLHLHYTCVGQLYNALHCTYPSVATLLHPLVRKAWREARLLWVHRLPRHQQQHIAQVPESSWCLCSETIDLLSHLLQWHSKSSYSHH